MTTIVAIVGATGRMGTLISRLVNESPEFELGAQLGSKDELAGILGADIVGDVTAPGPSQRIVEYAVSNGMNVLVGTSGWSRERIASLKHEVALQPGVGVIIVPNFSIGSALARQKIRKARRQHRVIRSSGFRSRPVLRSDRRG